MPSFSMLLVISLMLLGAVLANVGAELLAAVMKIGSLSSEIAQGILSSYQTSSNPWTVELYHLTWYEIHLTS